MPVRKRVYERPGGQTVRFLGSVEIAGDTRRRREKSFRTAREARAWVSKQQVLIDQLAISGAKTPRLGEHLDAWLERGTARVRKPWSPATAEDYESIVRAHLKPTLGHVRLEDLSVDHVEALLADIPGNRAVNIRTALSSALSMAVKQRLVPYNVAKLASIAEISRSSPGGLSQEDARVFLLAARGHRLGALFTVATALALRQSEVVGLRWMDVDVPKRELKVEQKIYRRGGQYHVGDPKSATSKRTVRFPAEIAEVLRLHRNATLKEQLGARKWEDYGLVFPNLSGGPLYGPYVTRAMQSIMKQAGLEPRRFHDLRHTGASILHALGVDIRTIQGVLGHASYQLTADTYTHPEETTMRDAADRMGGFLRSQG
jgi:integrase